jgi:hypothetical protein
MTTGYSATSWARIKRDYDDVITEIRDSKTSESGLIEKVVIFDDFTKLKCRERIQYGLIEFYQYDYYDANGNIIVKYHSEPHEKKEYQTVTEPFHMHVKKDKTDLAASKRLPLPEVLRTLDSIIATIITGRYLKYAYIDE